MTFAEEIPDDAVEQAVEEIADVIASARRNLAGQPWMRTIDMLEIMRQAMMVAWRRGWTARDELVKH